MPAVAKQSRRSTVFNAMEYGARGDFVTDDTAAFNAMFRDAALQSGGASRGAHVVIPPPPVSYRITGTIEINPQGDDTFCSMHVNGYARSDAIQWDGPDNTPVFLIKGLKFSTFHGVSVRPVDGTEGVVVWDLSGDNTWASLSGVTWSDCLIGGVGGANNIGWRIGHTSPGATDFSFLKWINCRVEWGSLFPGTIGWLNEGDNSLNHTWVGGWASSLAKGVSNRLTSGAVGTTAGGSSLFFYGLGMGSNEIDYDFAEHGTYAIVGGRYELGERFLHSEIHDSGSAGPTITVMGCEIDQYDPSDGTIFYCVNSTNLTVENCTVRRDPSLGDFGNELIKWWGSSGYGQLVVRGNKFRISDGPFFSKDQAAMPLAVVAEGNVRLNSSVQSIGRFPRIAHETVTVASGTYTLNAGDSFVAAATSGGAVTVNLESAARCGRGHIVTVKDFNGAAASNNVTINRNGSDTIQGSASYTISTNYGVVRLMSDGSATWLVV